MHIKFDVFVERLEKKRNIISFTIGIISLLSFVALQTPLVRIIIINVTEYFLNRQINFNHWDTYLFNKSLYPLILTFFAISINKYNNFIPNIIAKTEQIFSSNRWLKIIAIVLPWVVIIGLFATDNINNPNFWLDESGQFWMAKGLHHFSLPFATPGKLDAVLSNNVGHNLDPGGFTILLYFWTMISNKPFFLRLLPFLFFTFSMILVSKLCLIWFPNNITSYFAGLILLSSSLLRHYAFELRPYSMEVFAAILALYFFYKTPLILRNKRYALFTGLSMAVCITSRYSAFFLAGTLGCVILCEILFQNKNKKGIYNLIIFSIPIAISAFAIYLITLQNQNPTIKAPNYISPHMLKTGNISEILFNREAIEIYFPFLILFLLVIFTYKKETLSQLHRYVVFTIILNLFFVIFSITGTYTWSFSTRWDIATHTIFVLALLPLLFVIMKIFNILNKNQTASQLFFASAIFAIFAFVAYGYQYLAKDSMYVNYKNCTVTKDDQILTNIWASPTLRYLFEYGPLKNQNEIYHNVSWFDERENKISEDYILTSLDKFDQFDYIILQHFILEPENIKNMLEKQGHWVDCSLKGPSKMFKNTKND